MKKTPLQNAYGRYKAILGATFLFGFVINLLLFVGPIYMLQIYDRVLSSRNETTLVMLTVVAVGLLVTYGIMEYIRSRMLVRAGMQFDEVISAPLFSRAVKAQLANPAGGSQYILSDIDKIREFITGQGIIAFFDAPWVPLFLAICFLFHPWLGLVATVGALIIFILALANELMTRNFLKTAGNASQGANHFASATLQNAEVIRALGMEKQLADRWMSKHDAMLVDQAKASDRAGVVVSGSKFVRMTLQVAILGVGAYLVLHQEISAGIMIAASIIMGRALSPVEMAVGQWKQFIAARQADGRLKALLASVPETVTRTDLPAPKGNITVHQLTSAIPGTRITVLKNVSFALEAGDVMAMVGASGSGKSSLVRHLVGVWSPLAGTVRLDGAEIGHWDPDRLGEHLGYLPQDVKLFSGTVAENIARFHSPDSSDPIIEAAMLSGAHEMIQNFSEGYETQVGDGGTQLSGGQRQRVGLARALYNSPKLVVLDEPNSNLDQVGEAALHDAILRLKERGTTVIIVTHKMNLLSVSDKVLLLEDGLVKSFGPSSEFIKATQLVSQGVSKPKKAPAAKAVPYTVNIPRTA